MNAAVAAAKMAGFLLLIVALAPVQSTILRFSNGPASQKIPMLWHRSVCRVFGIRIRTEGTPHPGQTVFVGNHLSYLDIPVIGSRIRASFLAKKDVESWPVFGFLAKLQRTAYIERKTMAMRRAVDGMKARIAAGDSLFTFPEGTSTDGQDVWPFKSGIFESIIETRRPGLVVQPVALRVDRADGRPPQTQDERDIYAWHIHMETPLHEHLWRFARTRGADITLCFQPPLEITAETDRKTLAKAAHDSVRRAYFKSKITETAQPVWPPPSPVCYNAEERTAS